MKRLALLIATLLTASLAYSQTFTAHASGDWQSASTWGTSSGGGCHVSYPCMTDGYSSGPTNGDTVNLAGFAVTCIAGNEICTVGNSSSATSSCTAGTASMVDTSGGSLTVGATATFIYAGPVCLAFGTNTFQAGAKIYHDSSWAATPVGYAWVDSVSATPSSTWVIGSQGGARVFWQGDSYYSPNSCRLGAQSCNTHCNAANNSGCLAGPLGGNPSQSSESGAVTAYNLTIANVGGAATNAWTMYVINAHNSLFSGLEMYNSGPIRYKQAGNKTLTFDRSYITASANSSTFCFNSQSGSSATVNTIFSNDWFECAISPQQAPLTVNWLNTTIKFPWSAGTGYVANTHNYNAGIQTRDSASYDQVLWYSDGWASGTSSPSGDKLVQTVVNLTNSLILSPRNIPPVAGGATHLHPFDLTWQGDQGTTWIEKNNVLGTFGDLNTSAATENWQVGSPTGGNPASTGGVTMSTSGNVSLCGAQGRGSVMGFGGFFSTNTTANLAANSVSMYQNTFCSSVPSVSANYGGTGSNGTPMGGGMYGGEATSWSAPNMANTNANLFFRMDGVGVGDVPEIYSYAGSSDSVYSASNPWNSFNYNAVVNMTSASASIPPCGVITASPNGANNTCNWINASGRMSTATEIMLPAQVPQMVDPGRSWPMFSEYLNATGLFPYANYANTYTVDLGVGTVTTSYKGGSTSGTNYTPGQIVYVDGTLTGYSSMYSGRRSYWICKIAHTASGENRTN